MSAFWKYSGSAVSPGRCLALVAGLTVCACETLAGVENLELTTDASVSSNADAASEAVTPYDGQAASGESGDTGGSGSSSGGPGEAGGSGSSSGVEAGEDDGGMETGSSEPEAGGASDGGAPEGSASDSGGASDGSTSQDAASDAGPRPSPCPACAGCCDSTGHSCSQGTVSTACGHGNVCEDCMASGLVCQNKSCQ
jgi:hypothetical protein